MSPSSSRAYSIIALGNPQIISSLISNDVLRNAALEILTSKSVPPFVIGRLSSIILASLTTLPEEAVQSCGFIYHLLPFCSNSTVFNFFETICGSDSRFHSIQTWLINFGFEEYLIRELSNFDYSYVSAENNRFADPKLMQILCLYQLVSKGCASSTLGSSFKSKEMAQQMVKRFPSAPCFVLNAKWMAICSLCCSELCDVFLPLVGEAISILSEQFERLAAFRVYALTFLTKMMSLNASVYDSVLDSPAIQTMSALVVQFPRSTILHGAFRDFVDCGLKRLDFAERMIMLYSPIFIELSKGRCDRVISPTFLSLLIEFDEMSRKEPRVHAVLDKIPDFYSFFDSEVKNYQRVIQTPYGGEKSGMLVTILKGIFK